jgi:hypothetical protein
MHRSFAFDNEDNGEHAAACGPDIIVTGRPFRLI